MRAFGFNSRSEGLSYTGTFVCLCTYILYYIHIKHVRELASSTHGPRHIFKRAADIARKQKKKNKKSREREKEPTSTKKSFFASAAISPARRRPVFRLNDKPLRHVNPTTRRTEARLIRSAKVRSPAVRARISPLRPGRARAF